MSIQIPRQNISSFLGPQCEALRVFPRRTVAIDSISSLRYGKSNKLTPPIEGRRGEDDRGDTSKHIHLRRLVCFDGHRLFSNSRGIEDNESCTRCTLHACRIFHLFSVVFGIRSCNRCLFNPHCIDQFYRVQNTHWSLA